MPLIVDHDERRARIAEIVLDMIAESGIDSVTVRAVSRRAGFSSTILTHYFRDKAHLLAHAFASVLKETPRRVGSLMEADADLATCFDALLPINPMNLRDWQAWFGFWGTVTHDESLADARRAGVEETQKMLREILRYGQLRGELPPGIDIARQAIGLQIFLNGLVSMVLMTPQDWPAPAQHAALTAQLAAMRPLR